MDTITATEAIIQGMVIIMATGAIIRGMVIIMVMEVIIQVMVTITATALTNQVKGNKQTLSINGVNKVKKVPDTPKDVRHLFYF